MQPLSIAPSSSPRPEAHATTRYVTAGGVHVERHTLPLSLSEARAALEAIATAQRLSRTDTSDPTRQEA